MSIPRTLISKLPTKLKIILRFFCLETFYIIKKGVLLLSIKLKFNTKFYNKPEQFLKLHLGCGDRYKTGYLNLDSRPTKATDYVCNAVRLPFSDQSVEIIETYHMIEHLSQNEFMKALKEWWRVLIPGGELVIECPDFDQTVKEYLGGNQTRLNNIFGLRRFKGDSHVWGYNFLRLKKILEKHGFGAIKNSLPQDYHRLEEPCLRIQAYKSLSHLFKKDYYDEGWWSMRKSTRPETQQISWWEGHIFNKIFHEFEDQLFKNKKVIDLGCGSGEKDIIMAKNGHSITGIELSEKALEIAREHKKREKLDNIQFVNGSVMQMPFYDNTFDSGVMIEVLEHLDRIHIDRFFHEIKRVLKPEGQLLITVPHKFAYSDPGHIQTFTKGLLAKLLDEQGLHIDFIEWEKRKDAYREHDMLKVLCSVQENLAKQNRKICAIGAYNIRYDQLGFHWDGQARAFQKLGYDTLLLNIRIDSYENLRRKIIEFKPDVLWLGLKECLPFIAWMAEDLKKIGCIIVYWFCDLRGIEGKRGNLPLKKPIITPHKFKNLINYIFLSNAGQIEDYKKIFEMENVFYMGRSASKNFHRRVHLEEKFDIVFAGGLGRNIFHKKRTKLLKRISRSYNVQMRNDARNNISEFYSSGKLVFGADIINEGSEFQPYLYTSNRLFIALACGACYICQWFPGIEKLAENHKHLVWFKEEKELFEQLDYYLKNDKARETIRRNAQAWAYGAHTHLHRVENILDIIDEKTKNFYGFLE